ncbi:hypothetical protein [Aerosticca soli]|jgi:predicted membrane protein|uniref:Uncharacterized protein n=1 Tax=Aerosticca soli TaxID=2010829 RepID=A0A2Z6E2V5_9GAMM|nr:hypothetical protein [Aerosticca soli]MDI3262131.1 hypothetical protein [Fulvimonas sp.]BBD79403.1 hypothetical protein ALSL_0737 [Aerosticca soli]
MPNATTHARGALALTLAALVGCLIALYAYLMPLTGVTHTVGALAVILSSLVLAAIGLALRTVHGRGLRNTLYAVALVLLLGAVFAGLLLHQGWFCAAMLVGLAGLVADIAGSRRRPRDAAV